MFDPIPEPRKPSRRLRVSPLAGLLTIVAVSGIAIAWRQHSRLPDDPATDRRISARPPGDDADRLQRALQISDDDPQSALQILDQVPSDSKQYLLAVRHIARIALLADDAEPVMDASRALWAAARPLVLDRPAVLPRIWAT